MSRDYRRYLSGLYRDSENGWLYGVAAGLADRFETDAMIVRIGCVLGMIFFTLPTIILYVLAVVFLSDRPLSPRHPENERDFWRSNRSY